MATVWLVDDEESVRDVLSTMLQQIGHEARAFSDPHELAREYRRGQVDLVISDIRMPGCDGMALLRELREKDPHALVVMLTGYPSVEDGVEAIRAGAADYLAKPLRMEEIRLRILRALEIRELNDRLRRNRMLTWMLIGSLPFWFALGMALHLIIGCP